MAEKPVKLSNFVGFNIAKAENYIQDVDKDLKNIFTYLSVSPTLISQATEPNLTNGTFGFWRDTDDGKFYLLLKINNIQRKVELT